MRTLLLMRHAKSSWKDESLPDEERPLNKRGKETAAYMGEFLAGHKLVPEAILCSTAKRARQTAKRIKSAGCFDAEIIKAETLYFSGPRAYLQQIADLPATVNTALVIGHNPDLESLVARVARRHIEMPTATIVHLSTPISNWGDVLEDAKFAVEGVYRPKELGITAIRRKVRRPR